MSDECNLKGYFNENPQVMAVIVFLMVVIILMPCVCYRLGSRRLRRSDDNNLSNRLESLRSELDKAQREKDDALYRLSDDNLLSNRLESLRSELDKAQREKDDALYRLSEQASVLSRDGNPNIADLSDENRPDRLGPKFSELYDNEWTNAVEELESGRADKESEELTEKITGLLLDIVKFSFEVCREVTRKQLSLMQQMIIEPSLSDEGTRPNAQDNMQRGLSRELMKRVKDERKSVMPDLTRVTSIVQSRINDKYSEGEFGKYLSGDQLQTYMRSCIHVIWLMNVQDPPMILNFSEASPEQLRSYTKSGPVVDYHVWPTLYLYEGGPMMKKGVAQFKYPDDEADENLIRL